MVSLDSPAQSPGASVHVSPAEVQVLAVQVPPTAVQACVVVAVEGEIEQDPQASSVSCAVSEHEPSAAQASAFVALESEHVPSSPGPYSRHSPLLHVAPEQRPDQL